LFIRETVSKADNKKDGYRASLSGLVFLMNEAAQLTQDKEQWKKCLFII